jgi:hypothetical protein
MNDPARNSKERARRIERHYFKRKFALPRWRLRLTIMATIAGLSWIAWRAVAHDQSMFSSGPVDRHHASFGANCSSCHVSGGSAGATVTDKACLTCHDGPQHNDLQVSAPGCVACHVEHRGAAQLLGEGDHACTDCHSSLRTKNGHPSVATKIASFTDGHPEFKPLRDGQQDPGSIRFNHKKHFRKDLRGPSGNVQLECSDCHRAAGLRQPWPYGHEGASATVTQPVAARVGKHGPSTRAYMEPVNYYSHCSACHPLQFDKQIAESVPHRKPEEVMDFMRSRLRAWIAAHPEELQSAAGSPRIMREELNSRPRTADQWVDRHLQDAERLLWTKTCVECHSLDSIAGTEGLPRVRESNLKPRWLEHGSFDHGAHTMLDCAGCHTRARESEKTSDVLLPNINVCQSCHNPDSSSATAASNCFECHVYHDWSKEKPRHGNLGLPVS